MIPIDKCIIQNEIVDRIIKLIREYMIKYKIEGYDRKDKTGIIKKIY